MENRSAGNILFLILTVVAVFFTISCSSNGFDGDIKDGIRDIIIDVDNSIFNPVDAVTLWDQGPGVDKIIFTVSLENGAGDIEYIMETADVDSTYKYTQITIPVEGKLIQIDARAFKENSLLYSASIAEKSSVDSFYGWEIFANVKKVKLGFHGNTDNWADGFLTLDIAPRGWNSVTFKVDSGIIAAADLFTDWGNGLSDLSGRQIAIEPILNENPTDLTFDIYTLIVNTNLQEEYDPAFNDNANYENYPWENLWSYGEITESGKRIGDTNYILTKYNTLGMVNFIEPDGDGCGYNSFLIDLTGEAEDPVGKFLLVVLVMKYDILSVPTAIGIIEIN